MVNEFNTIDDFDVEDKTVLVRIDINSPVDPSSGIILDDTRLKLHAQTIKELSNKGAKVVLLAHQSRPGKKDFTTLSQHAETFLFRRITFKRSARTIKNFACKKFISVN